MKKALLLLTASLCLMACEPEAPVQPDPAPAPLTPVALEPVALPKGLYRKQFVGDYEYTIEYWSYSAGAYPDIYWDTTWHYTGYISLVRDSLNNRVRVHWGDGDLPLYRLPHLGQSNHFVVDTMGDLSYPEYCTTVQKTFLDAWIRNDTIRFEMTDGGAGSWRSWTVRGVKIE